MLFGALVPSRIARDGRPDLHTQAPHASPFGSDAHQAHQRMSPSSLTPTRRRSWIPSSCSAACPQPDPDTPQPCTLHARRLAGALLSHTHTACDRVLPTTSNSAVCPAESPACLTAQQPTPAGAHLPGAYSAARMQHAPLPADLDRSLTSPLPALPEQMVSPYVPSHAVRLRVGLHSTHLSACTCVYRFTCIVLGVAQDKPQQQL